MPKITIDKAPRTKGARYPKPYSEPCAKREFIRLGDAGGLTQFGVSITILRPGVWASQRHWHEKEDEFVYVLAGELVLIEDEGETVLRAGDCAAWRAGVRNGHHLINRSAQDASFLVVGTRDKDDWGEYPDIDLRFDLGKAGAIFSHKDGTPY